jgi:hypothetical protein
MSEQIDDAVRADVAAAHGLDPSAADLLTGSTLDAVEQSAQRLSALVESSRTSAEQAEPTDALRRALDPQSRAQRRRELARRLAAGPTQPRGEGGRFESRRVSFDGGARPRLPAPPETLEQASLRLVLAARATGRSSGGWSA